MRVNVVIPAAGLATRLRPLSTASSKAMVRVNGKPCVDYILERLHRNCDPAQVVIVDGQVEDIRSYCAERFPRVEFSRQEKLLGPRDAIARGCMALRDWSLPLVVWLGDAIILDDDLPLGQDFLLTKTVEDQSRWCMWNRHAFYNKPSEPVAEARALVGLYSMADGLNAVKSFANCPGYDISDALVIYGTNRLDERIAQHWYDIGETSSYYKTCAELLDMKARAFNHFRYDPDLNLLTKSPVSDDEAAISTLHDESCWYAGLSFNQQLFTPRTHADTNIVRGLRRTTLRMSYEPGTLLSDLALYDDLPESTWEYILRRLVKVMKTHFLLQPRNFAPDGMFRAQARRHWVDKSEQRLQDAHISGLIDMRDRVSLMGVAEQLSEVAQPVLCMHGDLHTGNVLYSPQVDHFVLIDPRGRYGDFMGCEGDDLYDWCKLAHDLYYGYNFLTVDRPPSAMLRRVFEKVLPEMHSSPDLVLAGGRLLLATCIPLHYEDYDRQSRFVEAVRTAA